MALEHHIEKGDFRTVAKIVGVGVGEFLDIAKDLAGIPTTD